MRFKYISWLPVVILMGIIFYFSSKPAEASNNHSLAVVNYIVNIYENITGTGHQDNGKLIEVLNLIIRKGAHFCEYAVLAAAIALHFYSWNRKGKRLIILPVIISAVYAATDEYHQTFIAGRSGQLSDVLLDSTGAATGSILFFLLVLVLNKFRNKTIRSSE